MPTYFDFHFHPLGKRFLSQFNDADRKNELCTEPIALPSLGKIADAFSGHILQSQACVSQAVKGGITLGVAAIVAVEYAFASRKGMLKLLELELNGKDVIAPLDNRLFDFVHNGRGSYNTLFKKELMFYLWAAGLSGNMVHLRHKINLLTRKKPGGSIPKDGALNLLLAMEGGHNLSERLINKLSGVSDPARLVKEYRQSDQMDLLYLTLTHLSHVPEQLLCSHAYGFKMVKDLPEARPQIKGLSPLGKQVVRACVDGKDDQRFPILIDIKHMSLQGRRDFYAYRRDLMADRPDGFIPPVGPDGKPWWPIIATHMGVTGFRSGELRNYIEEYGIEKGNEFSIRLRLGRKIAAKIPGGISVERVFFNPASIGLYDDDIEEIVRSRGMIGISLDARILGYEALPGRKKPDYDYLSREDFATLLPDLARKLPRLEAADDDIPETHENKPPAIEELFAGRSKRELYLFCLNVLHVVAVINKMPVAERHGLNGWDYVCLGSDYDGLIDSLQAANTSEQLPQFEQELQSYLPAAEKAYLKAYLNTHHILANHGEYQVDKVLRKLFYQNGERFVKQWWNMPTEKEKAILVEEAESRKV